MQCELAALIGCFLEREVAAAAAAGQKLIAGYEGGAEVAKGTGSSEEPELDNTWIMKPWNLARSMDATVSRHLAQILRLGETGPKVCQKYISRPALFNGRKFDMRFIVLLKRLKPLEAYLSDVFWARIANKAYSQMEDSLSDFQTHFTVMNYSGHKYEHVPTHEFVRAFEQQHNVTWQSIDQSVQRMLRELLAAAVTVHPEMQPDGDTCRAIYGVDVMLDDQFQPKLLEVTYCPDCTRAVTYDMKRVFPRPSSGGNAEADEESEWLRPKSFFNDVFGCLFLGETRNVRRL
ncbi:hypothetical protein CLOM_g19180 [Closterium sp. NIES-68]|nr:hypothetical protein CLOM_g19180 [Closterium sp. NIES-68]